MYFKLKPLAALFLIALSLWGARAKAQSSWLERATDCQSFSEGLKKYYLSLGDLRALSEERKEEIRLVIHTACERFAYCKFKTCNTIDQAAASVLSNSSGAQAPLSENAEAALPTWLLADLNCEQLRLEVRERYAKLGRLSELPAEKREELRKVLDVVCSERFAHCKFSRCGTANLPPVEESTLLSRQHSILQKRVAESRRALLLKIESETQREAQEGRNWVPFSVPADSRPPRAKETRTPRRLPRSSYSPSPGGS